MWVFQVDFLFDWFWLRNVLYVWCAQSFFLFFDSFKFKYFCGLKEEGHHTKFYECCSLYILYYFFVYFRFHDLFQKYAVFVVALFWWAIGKTCWHAIHTDHVEIYVYACLYRIGCLMAGIQNEWVQTKIKTNYAIFRSKNMWKWLYLVSLEKRCK